MKSHIRLFILGAILSIAQLAPGIAVADNHGQQNQPRHLYRPLDQYQGAFKRMKTSQVRKFLRDFRTHLNDQNRAAFTPRIRLFEAELRRRQQAGQPAGNQPAAVLPVERQARKLLAGAGPAQELRTPALRKRIGKTTKLYKNKTVQKKTRKRLKRLLKADRKVLNNRQAAVETPRAAVPGRAERVARKLLRQAPPSDQLRAPALRKRIGDVRGLLQEAALTPKTRRRLEGLLNEDRRALKQRRAAAAVSPAERDARKFLQRAVPSAELRTPRLRRRMQEAEQLLSNTELRPSTRDSLTKLHRRDRKELRGRQQTAQPQISQDEREARELLANAGEARGLTRKQLRRRLRQSQALLDSGNLRPKTRRRLEEWVRRDRKELEARRVAQDDTAESNADARARQLLRDDRVAGDLSDRQLRKRLGLTRQVLNEHGLSARLSKRLRKVLKRDRRELRARIEARRDQQDNVVDEPRRSDAVAALLNDRRASHSLRSRQLSRRIDRARGVLETANLNGRERTWIKDIVVSDRRELRQRLRHRRQRREAELDRRRRNNDLNIIISPQIEFAPRSDVAAAEADDTIIERQLVAPPTQRINRRYSFDEFRRRPELRRMMPAVEVDSIRFGFNESFVREEEIDELERLGAVIERVIAANPQEVFLIEGHTDAVGSEGYNLALSEKRAEAVRKALVEYFVIEPDNVATIGYGEQFLKIPTFEEEQENRRVTVRRITPLLTGRVQ